MTGTSIWLFDLINFATGNRTREPGQIDPDVRGCATHQCNSYGFRKLRFSSNPPANPPTFTETRDNTMACGLLSIQNHGEFVLCGLALRPTKAVPPCLTHCQDYLSLCPTNLKRRFSCSQKHTRAVKGLGPARGNLASIWSLSPGVWWDTWWRPQLKCLMSVCFSRQADHATVESSKMNGRLHNFRTALVSDPLPLFAIRTEVSLPPPPPATSWDASSLSPDPKQKKNWRSKTSKTWLQL